MMCPQCEGGLLHVVAEDEYGAVRVTEYVCDACGFPTVDETTVADVADELED